MKLLLCLPYDDDLNCIMRQKAATPVRQEMCADDLAEEMKSMAKPNAVVGERTSVGMADINAQTCFRRYKQQLPGAKDRRRSRKRRSFTLRTGKPAARPVFGRSILVLHFPTSSSFVQACQTLRRGVPWRAIAVMSPHHGWSSKTGFKSWLGGVRHKYVGIGCSGLRRGICIFRSALNLSRNLTLFSVPVLDEDVRVWKKLQPKDIEAGAIQLLKALQGNYISQGGKPKAVQRGRQQIAICSRANPGCAQASAEHAAHGEDHARHARSSKTDCGLKLKLCASSLALQSL